MRHRRVAAGTVRFAVFLVAWRTLGQALLTGIVVARAVVASAVYETVALKMANCLGDYLQVALRLRTCEGGGR